MFQQGIRPTRVYDIRDVLRSALSLVKLSHGLADAGRSVRFDGIDNIIRCLYTKIQQTDVQTIAELRPQILRIASDMNLLLEAHREMIPDDIQARIRSCIAAVPDRPRLV